MKHRWRSAIFEGSSIRTECHSIRHNPHAGWICTTLEQCFPMVITTTCTIENGFCRVWISVVGTNVSRSTSISYTYPEIKIYSMTIINNNSWICQSNCLTKHNPFASWWYKQLHPSACFVDSLFGKGYGHLRTELLLLELSYGGLLS